MKIMSKCAKLFFTPLNFKRQEMMLKADKLTNAVWAAHRSYTGGPSQFIFDMICYGPGFPVKGVPRDSVHVPTTPDETIELIRDIRKMVKLPDKINAADLGSGLGSFSMSLSMYLEYLNYYKDFHVTGFELSNYLRPHAEKIAGEQEIKNVSFVGKDFTELTKEDFRPFNLIYIYKPFDQCFPYIMADVFPRIASGTLIITRLCGEARILQVSSLFRPVFNPRFAKYQEEYSLFIRTDK